MRNVHVCFILSSSWCWIKKKEKKTFHKVLMYVEISLSILTPVAYQTMRGETVEMQLLPEPADTRHNRCIVCIILSIL